MRLLLDANLSWRLIKNLSNHFDQVLHVDTTMSNYPAKDMEIWDYARKNDLVIVTNDEDFLNLLLSKGFPPKVVLLRIGNQSTRSITELMVKKKPDILALYEHPDIGVLQIF